jgi:hypothetical protein
MEQHQPAFACGPNSSQLVDTSERTLMAAVHTAYRQGLQQPKMHEDYPWKVGWQQNLTTREWETDKGAVRNCILHLGKARQSAIRGDIATSCQLFGLAHTFAESLELSEEGKLFCRAELAAAEAYLDYVCGDFKQANRRLVDSMAADQQLEDQFGHELLHIHRIHLVNNIVKVEACAGRLTSAMELAASVLLYLEGERDTIPAPGAWGPAYLARLPLDALWFLSCQLAIDIAVATAGLTTAQGAPWRTLTEAIEIHKCHRSWQTEVGEWFQLKDIAVRSRGKEPFLHECIAYLEKGPRRACLLWQMIVIDAVEASRALCGDDAYTFRKTMLADLGKLTSLPRHVRTLLHEMQVADMGSSF